MELERQLDKAFAMSCMGVQRLFPYRRTGDMANNKRSLQTRLALGYEDDQVGLHMIPGFLAMGSSSNALIK